MHVCRILWKLVGPIIALLLLSGFPSPAWPQTGPTLVSDMDD